MCCRLFPILLLTFPALLTIVPPVIANGKLYLRDQELIFCYQVK